MGVSLISPRVIENKTWRLKNLIAPPVLQNHRVYDLPANDASPPPEIFMETKEYFMDHDACTAVAPHLVLLMGMDYVNVLLLQSRRKGFSFLPRHELCTMGSAFGSKNSIFMRSFSKGALLGCVRLKSLGILRSVKPFMRLIPLTSISSLRIIFLFLNPRR